MKYIKIVIIHWKDKTRNQLQGSDMISAK